MEENRQWQAFVETGDIRHYLRYKQAQAMASTSGAMHTSGMQSAAISSIETQKEFADGRNCDVSTGITRSEV